MIDITFKKVIRVMTSETTVLVENQASPAGTASVQNGGTVQTKEVNLKQSIWGGDMALHEIPLTNTNQQFNVRLGSIIYKLRLIYRLDAWYLDILDSSGQLILAAIPLIQGVSLLVQHQPLIKGGLFVLNSNADESQSFNDLGVKIQLFWRE